MTKKNWFYIIFFTVLVVGFYLALSALISGFGKTKSPTLSYVRPFFFKTQEGKIFTNKDVEGKVFVAEYFFTTCKTICPIMNSNMRMVYDHFKDEKDFVILSHTSDPDNDSVAQLKKYADSMSVSSSHWVFLTGRKDSLYNMARVSYIIDDPNNNVVDIKDDFIHTQLWAVVDKKGNIRKKIYDGLKPSEVRTMINDIEELLKE
ncbi:MAG TPA: SCO family protein [Chitinophagaceae bacterium]|nr:SCO family protein [Chitinophagaceae bacterium]